MIDIQYCVKCRLSSHCANFQSSIINQQLFVICNQKMNFAIIAAGEGSRLVAEGITVPKPLVRICDVPLIDRLIDIFIRNGATTVNVIVNGENRQTIRHLQSKWLKVPFQMIARSTPGSMHSLYELRSFLRNGDFCLTTDRKSVV